MMMKEQKKGKGVPRDKEKTLDLSAKSGALQLNNEGSHRLRGASNMTLKMLCTIHQLLYLRNPFPDGNISRNPKSIFQLITQVKLFNFFF